MTADSAGLMHAVPSVPDLTPAQRRCAAAQQALAAAFARAADQSLDETGVLMTGVTGAQMTDVTRRPIPCFVCCQTQEAVAHNVAAVGVCAGAHEPR